MRSLQCASVSAPSPSTSTRTSTSSSRRRSTPQILELANRIVPDLGGAEKVLRPTCGDGPSPIVRAFATGEAEGDFIVRRIVELHDEGTPYEEIAVLCRT